MTGREAVLEQIRELEELDHFSKNLSRSRVIDPADALLVEENLNRFRLVKVETDRLIVTAKKELEGKTGLAVDNLEMTKSKPNLSSQVWNQLEQRIRSLPKVRRSDLRLQSIESDRVSNQRWWVPSLNVNAGVDQALTQVDAGATSDFRPFAGVSLQTSFGSDLVSANSERLSALGRLETEKGRRAEIDYSSRLAATREAWTLVQTEIELAVARKANLERLQRLQIVKYRSGRLSFLNLNDVMLSLLDARKQVLTFTLALARIDREVRLAWQMSQASDEFFGGCKERVRL